MSMPSILADWLPALAIPDVDPVPPVDVDRWTRAFSALLVAGDVHVVAGELRLSDERHAEQFDSPKAWLDSGLVQAGQPRVLVDAELLLKRLDSLDLPAIAYVEWYEKAVDALGPTDRVDPELLRAAEARLQDHAIATYYLFFPVQDGLKFGVHPFAWEGAWSAFSVLAKHGRDQLEPVLAGFQGDLVTVLTKWPEVQHHKGRPLAYVAVGTHTLLPTAGTHELAVVGQALDGADLEDFVSETGSAAGKLADLVVTIFLVGCFFHLTGRFDLGFAIWAFALAVAALALLVWLVLCLLSLIAWLLDDDDSDSSGSDSSSDFEQAEGEEVFDAGASHPFGDSQHDSPSDRAAAAAAQEIVDHAGTATIRETAHDDFDVKVTSQVPASKATWWNSRGGWGRRGVPSTQILDGPPRPPLARRFAWAVVDE